MEEAADRGATSDQTTSVCQTRSSGASRGEAEILQTDLLGLSPSGIGGRELGEALGADPPRTRAIETAETPHGEAQADEVGHEGRKVHGWELLA